MRSDVIHVTSEGDGYNEALDQADRVAVFKSLSAKGKIHLHLLTEEMMGMMQALTGEREAEFWIDDEDGITRLHLKAQAEMNSEMRSKLLSASTTGENIAAKGVMGKLRDVFERFLEPIDGEFSNIYVDRLSFAGMDRGTVSVAAAGLWSLNQYKSAVQEGRAPKENWDELEKSVVTHVADDIKVSIRNQQVEMVIYKKFD